MTDVQVTLSLPVLKVGSSPESGPTVIKHLQLMLNQRGGFPILIEDGEFGPSTETSVKHYQQNENLAADGVVGKQTWTSLLNKWLLLQRHVGGAEERRHDGRIAVDRSNLRWCSDGFELGCDNGEKVRIAFALDCCDREAMGFVATTEGIKGEDVRDLMVTAVEHRFGQINRLPETIEWLTDNGSGYIAHDTRRFARDIGFEPRTTPVESPQSNGMAEAFVRTIKRDYARVSQLPDAAAVMRQLPAWFEHYNTVHPHRALRYRSPREFIASRSNPENMSDL